MTDTAPICPHCGKIQSDASNGGDPGEWWGLKDGEETGVECDDCRKPFIVDVSWTPTFRGINDDHEDWDEVKENQ